MESIIQDYLVLLHTGCVGACGWAYKACYWIKTASKLNFLLDYRQLHATRIHLNTARLKNSLLKICLRYLFIGNWWTFSGSDKLIAQFQKSGEWRGHNSERQNQFSCSTNWKVKKTILFTGRCAYRNSWPFAQGVHFSSSALSQVKSPEGKLVGDEGYLVDDVSCRIVTLSSRDQVGSDRTRKIS